MKCLTAKLNANELVRAEESYVRKFGTAPPEFPEGGSERLAKLYRTAIGRNQLLQMSENGVRIVDLRTKYAARFGIEPVSCNIWWGFGASGPVRQLQLLERALEDGSRRLLLETVDFEGFDDLFLDDLGYDEFEDVRLDGSGRPFLLITVSERVEGDGIERI